MPINSTTSRALLLHRHRRHFPCFHARPPRPASPSTTTGACWCAARCRWRCPRAPPTQRVELGPIDPSSLVSLDQGVVINRALFDAAEDENAVLRRLVGPEAHGRAREAGRRHGDLPGDAAGRRPVALPHARRHGRLRQPRRRAALSRRCREHDPGGHAGAHVGIGTEGPAPRLVHRRRAVERELQRHARCEGGAGHR